MDWNEAKVWEESSNKDRDSWSVPTWRWDCNFKLDFDGPIVWISSRFYRDTDWSTGGDGWMTLCIGEEEIAKIEIKGSSLDDVKAKALAQNSEWTTRIAKAIRSELLK